MSDLNTSEDSLENYEDYLQQALQLAEPIRRVRSQAYILIVGDSQTGKSMLARSFTRFPRTAAKRYHTIAINPENRSYGKSKKSSIGLHFFCAPFRSGDENCFLNEPLKDQPYSLIIYLFDVNRRDTFDNVVQKWRFEVTTYLGIHRMPPSLLVGNKIDLRSFGTGNGAVSYDEGQMTAMVVDAQDYIEVNALAEINTKQVLITLLRILNVFWEPDF